MLPKEFREALGLREGDELLLSLHGDKIIIEKREDPFKVLEELLEGISFDRSLRKVAEAEAMKIVKVYEVEKNGCKGAR